MSIFKLLDHKKMLEEEWFPTPVIRSFAEEVHHPRLWKPTIVAGVTVSHPMSWLKKKPQ